MSVASLDVTTRQESQPGVEPVSRWKRYTYRLIAAEISAMTRYFDRVIHWRIPEGDHNYLFQCLEAPKKLEVAGRETLPDLSSQPDVRSAIFLNGTFNHYLDVQELLARMKPRLARSSRVIVVMYNPYLFWLYHAAHALGLRSGPEPSTFMTRTDVLNLARLAGYSLVRIRPAAVFPFRLLGLGSILNAVLIAIPALRWLGLVSIAVLRPLVSERRRPSLTVVIPARNERGNIEATMARLPRLGAALEVIFVEGHSTDGTWDEIQRVTKLYRSEVSLLALQQTGRGKGDAVRAGFARASGELCAILDADLSIPPELLGRFYDAYAAGAADFINGTRLVYPMEGGAMRFLNRLGNVFFAKALSAVLDVKIGDSLCGTKLLATADYRRIAQWRDDFGHFDPFGDFELLFAAASLALDVVDVPIRYRARTYGATNISRFRHGWMLLRMTMVGLVRIRMGRLPR